MSFLCKNPGPLHIQTLKDTPQFENFVVCEEINWRSEEHIFKVGKSQTECRVREAIIADDSAHMLLSILGNLIDKIKEHSPCLITNVTTESFNGIRFATTSASEIFTSPQSFQSTLGCDKAIIERQNSVLPIGILCENDQVPCMCESRQ